MEGRRRITRSALACARATTDNLAFSGEVSARKHPVNALRDLPDMVYRMLSDVCPQRGRIDEEIVP